MQTFGIRIWFVVSSFCPVLLLGCGGTGATPASLPTFQEPSPSPFRGRLEAALLLEKRQEQIDAIAKVARDAAEAGNAGVVHEALTHEKMKNVQMDQIVTQCSLSLAKAGKINEGIKLLDLMKDPQQRQQVLKQIAEGDFTP